MYSTSSVSRSKGRTEKIEGFQFRNFPVSRKGDRDFKNIEKNTFETPKGSECTAYFQSREAVRKGESSTKHARRICELSLSMPMPTGLQSDPPLLPENTFSATKGNKSPTTKMLCTAKIGRRQELCPYSLFRYLGTVTRQSPRSTRVSRIAQTLCARRRSARFTRPYRHICTLVQDTLPYLESRTVR